MKSEINKFLVTCVLALLTLLVPSFYGDSLVITIPLLFIIGMLMLSVEWSKKHLVYYLAIFVSGPLAESFSIYFGAWTYTTPFFIGIPLWLPFVWGNAGLYVLRLKSLIDYLFSLSKLSK